MDCRVASKILLAMTDKCDFKMKFFKTGDTNLKISFLAVIIAAVVCICVAIAPYFYRSAAQRYENKGDDYSFRGKYIFAAGYYKKAIDLNPQNFEVYEKYGAVLSALENYAGAVKIGQKLVSQNPQSPSAHYSLACAYLYQAIGKNDESIYNKSIESLREAIALNPKSEAFYFTLAKAYEDAQRYDDARKAYQEFASKNIYDKAAIYNFIGNTYFVEKKYDQALDYYNKAIAQDRNYAVSFVNAGDALMEKGDAQAALSKYQQAVLLDPNLNEVLLKMAQIYCNKALYEEAVECCKKVLATDPDDGDANYFMGAALKNLDQVRQAQEYFKKAAVYGSDKAVEELKSCGITIRE